MKDGSHRLTEKELVEIYRWLSICRKFDEAWVKLYYDQGNVETPHSNAGQEAVVVGSLCDLRKTDWVVPSLRARPVFIVRGVPLDVQFAGIMGKATSPSQGRATSHHMGDNERGIVGTTGLVGSQIPIATGVALACKLRKTDSVVMCFFGDGASNTGNFHEALNFAGIKRLPIVFVCENNQYAEWTPLRSHLPIPDVALRAGSYGLPGVKVDGNDVLIVRSAVQEAVSRARHGDGPTLVNCETYRLRDHTEGFVDGRPTQELQEWREKDPIPRFEKYLVSEGIATREAIAELNETLQNEITEALGLAESSELPEARAGLTEVYAPTDLPCGDVPQGDSREVSMGEALNEALREEMTRDPSVFLLGEDIGKESIGPGIPPMGGVWPPTRGLAREFPERVIGSPISESEMVGAAVGAALVGMRPVVELMYADFLALAMDQLVNSAAKMRYNYGGKASVPMVVRTAFGSIGEGLHHSQSTEAWLMNAPGLKIVMPSNAKDAKGLLKASIRDGNPVIFFEHKKLYTMRCPVPNEEYLVALGRGDVKLHGSDVTVVATGYMVHTCISAAKRLKENGISAEVVDPRTLRPLDAETILQSVRKTGRVVIVHEASTFGGFGAEIASQIAENAIEYLNAPIVRIGAPETPVPFSRVLERNHVPSEERIVAEISNMPGI
jgi:2-oxoisovalerate dehydrogenase E1 component